MQRPKQSQLAKILGSLASDDSKILVEGKRDKNALIKGGISRSRIYIAAHMSCNKFDRLMSNDDIKKVVLLFDNDRSGYQRTERFERYFSGYDTEFDVSYMRSLKRSGITYVEELNNLLV